MPKRDKSGNVAVELEPEDCYAPLLKKVINILTGIPLENRAKTATKLGNSLRSHCNLIGILPPHLVLKVSKLSLAPSLFNVNGSVKAYKTLARQRNASLFVVHDEATIAVKAEELGRIPLAAVNSNTLTELCKVAFSLKPETVVGLLAKRGVLRQLEMTDGSIEYLLDDERALRDLLCDLEDAEERIMIFLSPQEERRDKDRSRASTWDGESSSSSSSCVRSYSPVPRYDRSYLDRLSYHRYDRARSRSRSPRSRSPRSRSPRSRSRPRFFRSDYYEPRRDKPSHRSRRRSDKGRSHKAPRY